MILLLHTFVCNEAYAFSKPPPPLSVQWFSEANFVGSGKFSSISFDLRKIGDVTIKHPTFQKRKASINGSA